MHGRHLPALNIGLQNLFPHEMGVKVIEHDGYIVSKGLWYKESKHFDFTSYHKLSLLGEYNNDDNKARIQPGCHQVNNFQD